LALLVQLLAVGDPFCILKKWALSLRIIQVLLLTLPAVCWIKNRDGAACHVAPSIQHATGRSAAARRRDGGEVGRNTLLAIVAPRGTSTLDGTSRRALACSRRSPRPYCPFLPAFAPPRSRTSVTRHSQLSRVLPPRVHRYRYDLPAPPTAGPRREREEAAGGGPPARFDRSGPRASRHGGEFAIVVLSRILPPRVEPHPSLPCFLLARPQSEDETLIVAEPGAGASGEPRSIPAVQAAKESLVLIFAAAARTAASSEPIWAPPAREETCTVSGRGSSKRRGSDTSAGTHRDNKLHNPQSGKALPRARSSVLEGAGIEQSSGRATLYMMSWPRRQPRCPTGKARSDCNSENIGRLRFLWSSSSRGVRSENGGNILLLTVRLCCLVDCAVKPRHCVDFTLKPPHCVDFTLKPPQCVDLLVKLRSFRSETSASQ
jgi:hypothetical protein